MRQDFTQQHVRIAISTVFGKDKLLLDSFAGTETLSKPFTFTLSMRSGEVALDPDTMWSRGLLQWDGIWRPCELGSSFEATPASSMSSGVMPSCRHSARSR